MKFRHAIRIGDNATDILKLPCVSGCMKLNDKNGFEWLEYIIRDCACDRAEKGDWLCEGYDGQWHCLSDEEYQEGGEKW